MDRPNIYEFFNTMSDAEFRDKFLELSRTDEFSAVASSAGNTKDVAKVKNALIAAGVQKDWVGKDEMFHATINHITHRIINKTT